MLCQIDLCCEYAEKYGRTVIVDTAFPNAWTFKDAFSNYFVSKQRGLRLVHQPELIQKANGSIAPNFISERIETYYTGFNSKIANLVDSISGLPLTFDFNRDHPETILLHNQCGGGTRSLHALARLRIHDLLVDILCLRLKEIGGRYSAFHIRNTDYKTDFREFVRSESKKIVGPIFVATDSFDTLVECKNIIGKERVYSFADLPVGSNEPLQFSSDNIAIINRDSIIDLCMLAISKKLFVKKIIRSENLRAPEYSGFSTLAVNLHASKSHIRRLVDRSDDLIDSLIGFD